MAELIDLVGLRFGKLTVISKGNVRRTSGGQHIATWNCKCDCGNTTTVDGQKLRRGHTTSCGCARHENTCRKEDIVGKKFGRLTVIKFIPKPEREDYRRQWLCKCECDNLVQVNGSKLRNGHTKSCGCLERELIGNVNRKYKHKDLRLYRIWKAIQQRCSDVNGREYHNYGGRGIRVCKEWLNAKQGFDRFYEWAIENGYTNKLTIDRIDTNKGYSPENCRWVTNKTQQNNKRNNVILTYNGESHTMKEWSELLSVNYSTLRYHIYTKKRNLTEYINNYYDR